MIRPALLFACFATCALSPFSLLASVDDSVQAISSPAAQERVYTIPVSGTVEPGMAAYIGRALRTVRDSGGTVAILEMDTFGGRVDAAFQIVDTILAQDKVRTIAYVKTKAISAGALVALSCDALYMRHNTTIGDCAPISVSNNMPTMLGEKFQSPLRAKFRTLARKNGYSQALAESMVSLEMIVLRIETADSIFYVDSLAYEDLSPALKRKVTNRSTVVSRGELLTMDDTEARELGFSRGSVDSPEAVLELEGIGNALLVPVEGNWSEGLVKFLTTVAPILMLIGFGALYLESRTPGIGWAGGIGAVCLLLVYFGQHLVGLADYTELILLAAGGVLLAVDMFFTPGFGVIGLGGLGLMAVGMVLSMQGFVLPNPEMPWEGRLFAANAFRVIAAFFLGVVLTLVALRYALPRLSAVIPGPYLNATLKSAHVSRRDSAAITIGDTGVVISTLRPSGKARFGTGDVDVVAEGDFLEKGERVNVVAVDGNRVVVERSGKS